MNNNVLLLTYDTIQGYSTYGWFKDIKEIDDFVSEHGENIKSLTECIDTTNAKEIDLSELGK